MRDNPVPDPETFPRRRSVHGAPATLALGREVAHVLQGGEIVLLHGRLGAGKTCFCQGVCAGLGVDEYVVSPTFTLVNTYHGRLTVHHLDFFRVETGQSLADIGVPDLLDEVWDGGAVALVEWPLLLLPELAGTATLEFLVTPGAGPDDRTWHLRGEPEVPPAWAKLFPVRGTP